MTESQAPRDFADGGVRIPLGVAPLTCEDARHVSTGDESKKATARGALTEPKRAVVRRPARLKLPVSMRRSRDNLLIPSSYATLPPGPSDPPQTARERRPELELEGQSAAQGPPTRRGITPSTSGPSHRTEHRVHHADANETEPPEPPRIDLSSDLEEISPDDLQPAYAFGTATRSDASQSVLKTMPAPEAVNDPGGTQPLNFNEQPTPGGAVADSQQALETQLDGVLANGYPISTDPQQSAGVQNELAPESVIAANTPATASLEDTLERALALSEPPPPTPRIELEGALALSEPPPPTPRIEQASAPQAGATELKTNVEASPKSPLVPDTVRDATGTTQPATDKSANSTAITTPPTRPQHSTSKGSGLLLWTVVLVLGAVAWLGLRSADTDLVDDSPRAIPAEQVATEAVSPKNAVPESPEFAAVQPKSAKGATGSKPKALTSPAKIRAPQADSKPHAASGTTGPVSAPMKASELTASDLKRLPDDLRPVAVIYLMQELAKHMNNCHRGGRTNGTVDVLFTFQSDGKVAEAKLIGEPVASAPVSACLRRLAKGFKLPTKKGEGLQLRRRIRLR